MSSKATKLFTALVKMRNGAGKLHYTRLATAYALLADKAWVTDPAGGGGNIEKAFRLLEDKCFADICGDLSLSALLDMYHHNQDLVKWRACNFNLRKLWAEWSATKRAEQRRTAPPTPRAPSGFVQPSQLEQLTPTKVRVEYERIVRRVETDQEKIRRLQARVAELETENAQLKDQIEGMKKRARELAAAV